MLTAKRHWAAPELVVVTNDEPWDAGNVVYRWNEKHQVGTRTKGHAGERPTMRAIRAAIAEAV